MHFLFLFLTVPYQPQSQSQLQFHVDFGNEIISLRATAPLYAYEFPTQANAQINIPFHLQGEHPKVGEAKHF